MFISLLRKHTIIKLLAPTVGDYAPLCLIILTLENLFITLTV